jgi:predicted transcriptional regulator
MPVRNTSKAAQLANIESGFNSTKRAQVFSFIYEHPGCSRADIERGLKGIKINCVCGRVNELLVAGAIVEKGCKHDPMTRRSVNLLFVAYERDVA